MFSVSIMLFHLLAAAVGAKNSVSFPPTNQGPDAAAVTVADKSVNSNADS